MDRLFGWPEKEFSPENCVLSKYGEEPWILMNAGDDAVDFTLQSASDEQINLGNLLKTKPVCITIRMCTCPHFQATAKKMQEKAERYKENFHFILINSMQPHPQKPFKSAETGKVSDFGIQ